MKKRKTKKHVKPKLTATTYGWRGIQFGFDESSDRHKISVTIRRGNNSVVISL